MATASRTAPTATGLAGTTTGVDVRQQRPARGSSPATTTTADPIRLALVNDYEIIVQGLHSMLEPFTDRVAIVEHDVMSTPDQRVDVALFDTFAAHRDSIDRSLTMRREGRADHVVLYTWDAPPAFLEAARAAGVSAVLRKSLSGAQLVDALELVASGRSVPADELDDVDDLANEPLSLREREVLALMALGLSNSQIGEEMFLSVDTIKTHVRRVFRKLGVRNRTQAALIAGEYGLAPPAARVSRLPSNGNGVDPT